MAVVGVSPGLSVGLRRMRLRVRLPDPSSLRATAMLNPPVVENERRTQAFSGELTGSGQADTARTLARLRVKVKVEGVGLSCVSKCGLQREHD